MALTLEERWWAKVEEGPPPPGRPDLGPCLLWTGAKSRSRGGEWYGVISMDGASEGAHRVAHLLFIGPIPAGAHVHHRCHVTMCVRPGHLKAVTPRQNLMADDTPTRRNAQKTHCKRNHEFTPENTRMTTKGMRQCRTCLRMLNRKYKAESRSKRGVDT